MLSQCFQYLLLGLVAIVTIWVTAKRLRKQKYPLNLLTYKPKYFFGRMNVEH